MNVFFFKHHNRTWQFNHLTITHTHTINVYYTRRNCTCSSTHDLVCSEERSNFRRIDIDQNMLVFFAMLDPTKPNQIVEERRRWTYDGHGA